MFASCVPVKVHLIFDDEEHRLPLAVIHRQQLLIDKFYV